MARRAGRLIVGAFVAAVFLAGAEAVVRVAGVGPDTFPSPLPFQDVGPLEVETRGDTRIWPFGRRRAALAEAPGLRLFLFGESAAEGDGYTPWVSMGGVMERTLRATLPEPVEVLNLATPGVGSRQIVTVVADALAAERPDVVVLYIGNNELHELRALKGGSPRYDARGELLRRRLWNLHLYRVLATWLRPTASPPTPQTPLRDMETPADADDRALAMLLYEENLGKMLDAAAAVSVPVVMATVAVNELDWFDGRDAAETAAYKAGRRKLDAGDLAGGRAAIRAAESGASRPLRALPEARAIVRRLAAARGVTLCDVDTMLTERAPGGLPGDDLFMGACHPNVEGHEQIGGMLAQCVLDATKRAEPLVRSPIVPDPSRLDRWIGRREPELPDDGTAERAFERSHQAFLQRDMAAARTALQLAETRGGSPGALAVDRALLHLYDGDLPAAQAGLAEAAVAYPDDVQLAELRAALTGPAVDGGAR